MDGFTYWQSESDTYGDNKMRIGLITLWMLFATTNASADYFNQRNIIEECAKDSSIGSTCYIYLAAYADFLAWFGHATDAQRARSVCILSLETERIAKRLAQAKPLSSGYQVTELIVDEFCN